MASLKTISILLALTFAILVVYSQVQYHDFVNYDDPVYIADNPMVQGGLSWDGTRWAFESEMASNWHPLTWLSHMLDVQLFGKKPAGHHLTNIFFHLANTLLLFLILKEMTTAPGRSALVAAMFAIHPLHVESVAWIAERKDVLAAFFWCITMVFYVGYVKRPSKMKYLAVLFFYIMGLMSKPMVVTLPFVLLLLDFWPLQRLSPAGTGRQRSRMVLGPLIYEKIPLFFFSLLSCIITYHVQEKGRSVGSLRFMPLSVRISNASIAYMDYLDKTLWPRDLAVFYPYHDTVFLSKALGAALLVLFISLFAVYARKRFPYLFVGWFWYLGTLIPVIGLVQVGMQAAADRYTYLPLIGIFMILSWGLGQIILTLPGKRIVLSICSLLLLSLWTFTSWHHVSYWNNSISLFEHALSVTRENSVAHLNLGEALSKAGRNSEAMQHYREALRINPASSQAINNMGLELEHRGQHREAEEYYRRALRLDPFSESAHLNLGDQLAKAGTPERAKEAIQHFFSALNINPYSYNAHYNLGIMFLTTRREEAIAHFEAAVRLNPEFTMAHEQLGSIYAQKGIPVRAAFHYGEALKGNPRLAMLHNNLAGQLLLQGKTDEAMSHLQTALQINPLYPEAHYNMGYILMMQGRANAARRHFEEALRQAPTDKKIKAAVERMGSLLPLNKKDNSRK